MSRSSGMFDFDGCVRDLAMIMQLHEYYNKVLLKRDAMSSPYARALSCYREWRRVNELLNEGIGDDDQTNYYRKFDGLLYTVETKFDYLADEVLDPHEAFSIKRFILFGEPEKSIRELARVYLVHALRN